MPPPSSTDSGPVPPVFSPPAADMVTASSVPAESLQPPPPPPAPPSLPFSNPPRPSVITSPSPCQSPASPVHQSQPRARIRSRTPPLSLRPSHFATSIIPQNTRRRLRLRRSLNNAPIATSHNRNNNSSTNNNNSNIEIDNALRNETVSNSPPPWSALRTPQPSPPPPSQPPSLAPSASNIPNPAPDPFVHNPHPAQSMTHPPHAPTPAPASISSNAASCSVPLPPHPLSQFGPSRSVTVPYSSTQPSTSHNNQNPSQNAHVRPATANPSRVPRSTAIDELIAVLERNAPPLPTVRNVIARTHLPALNPNQPQHQENTSTLPPSSTHCPSNSNYPSTSGVAAPSYSGNAISSSHSQQFPDPPGLACIPSVEQPPQLAPVNTLAHRQSDGSGPNHSSNFPPTSQPPHQSSQQHSEYHRSMNPFVSTSMINASNNGNDNNNRNGNNFNPHGGTDRLRWHAPSDTTSPPSPPAPNSPLPLPAPSVLDSARASSAQAGTSSGFGPPPGVPASLWPMPPLTRDNMLPRMTSGPVQRGISPYRSSLRHTHLSSRVSRPFSRDASTTSPITSAGPNNGQHTHHPSLPSFSAPSLRSYERQSAELDAALTAAQAAATASVGRLGGNTDDDATRERDRGRERERERDRSRRISDIVMDDDVVLVGTSTNPMNAGSSRMGHISSSVAGNNGGGSSGRRSVSFNVGAGSSSGAGSMSGVPFDILHDERRESDEDGGGVQSAPFSGGASHPFVPSGSGWGPAHDIDNSYGEHLRRARMSRVLRMMGNTSRRAAQVSDDMRLIFGNDDEAVPSGGDAMNAIGFRSSSNNHPGSASATVRALTTATGNAGGQGIGFNGGGAAGLPSGPGLGAYGAYGSGHGGAGEFRNADGVRSLMLSENDTDIMMNEFDAMEYLNSINLHPRHRDRERERDRDRDRDRDRGRDRSQVMRVAASRAGALRQMTRISRMPPMESMLRRCEVRAMVAGREFGVPCGLFEYSVRGRPSLTPTIDWPDVMLISDENVKPRAPILDLMAEPHVNWCVRVGPLGNGEGDGRRGYQGFVNGLIDGGFAIELQITRGIIYLWALTFPPHGQCLLGVFRPDRPPCTSNNNGNATGTSVPTSSPAPPTVSPNDNNRMATDTITPVAAAAATAVTDTTAASTASATAATTVTAADVHNTQSNVAAAPATPVSDPTGAVESAQAM